MTAVEGTSALKLSVTGHRGHTRSLTPGDVRHKQFSTVRLREGYDLGEVDAFLYEVEAELIRLHGVNEELLAENAELRAKLADADRGAPRVRPTESESVARIVELAQQAADQALTEAREKAADIVAEAQARAEEMESSARRSAEARERETQEKHDAALRALEETRTTLERRLGELRAFAGEYRSRLKLSLEDQRRQVEEQLRQLEHDDEVLVLPDPEQEASSPEPAVPEPAAEAPVVLAASPAASVASQRPAPARQWSRPAGLRQTGAPVDDFLADNWLDN
jgi:DivIVA domain-containing protein